MESASERPVTDTLMSRRAVASHSTQTDAGESIKSDANETTTLDPRLDGIVPATGGKRNICVRRGNVQIGEQGDLRELAARRAIRRRELEAEASEDDSGETSRDEKRSRTLLPGEKRK